MSSSTEGGKSMGWCCMQGLNFGVAICPPDPGNRWLYSTISPCQKPFYVIAAPTGKPSGGSGKRKARQDLSDLGGPNCNASFDTAPLRPSLAGTSVPRFGVVTWVNSKTTLSILPKSGTSRNGSILQMIFRYARTSTHVAVTAKPTESTNADSVSPPRTNRETRKKTTAATTMPFI